jgi:hypothetical protein
MPGARDFLLIRFSFVGPPLWFRVRNDLSSGVTGLTDLSRALLPCPESRSRQAASSIRNATSGGKGSSQPAATQGSRKTRVQPNDIVVFANHAGTWKVVAAVNGSKADIRRRGGFDTRIVTARLESLTVVRRAGSPGYTY